MIKTWTIHKSIEHAINVMFDALIMNFTHNYMYIKASNLNSSHIGLVADNIIFADPKRFDCFELPVRIVKPGCVIVVTPVSPSERTSIFNSNLFGLENDDVLCIKL